MFDSALDVFVFGNILAMILGEDPKHVSHLNMNLSLVLSLGLSLSLSLTLSLRLSLNPSLSLSLSPSLSLSLGVGLGQAFRGCIWESSGREGQKSLMFIVKIVIFTKTLKMPNVYCTFHSKVLIWLEVCVSSGHFTRGF